MRAAASLIALVLVAAACGCGGDDKSSSSGIETTIEAETTGTGGSAADVRRTVTDYMEALNADDAKAMCAVLTDTGKKGLASLRPSNEANESCEQVAAQVARASVPIPRFRVDQVSASSGRATARVTSRDPRYEAGVLLAGDEGGWKISYPPGPLEKAPGGPGVPLQQDEPG